MVWIVLGVFVHAAVVWMLWMEARDQSQQRGDSDAAQTRTRQSGTHALTFRRHVGRK